MDTVSSTTCKDNTGYYNVVIICCNTWGYCILSVEYKNLYPLCFTMYVLCKPMHIV